MIKTTHEMTCDACGGVIKAPDARSTDAWGFARKPDVRIVIAWDTHSGSGIQFEHCQACLDVLVERIDAKRNARDRYAREHGHELQLNIYGDKKR